MVRIKKSWCYKNETRIVLQLSLSHEAIPYKKAYLVLDYSRRPCQLSLSTQNSSATCEHDQLWNSTVRPLLSEQVLGSLKADRHSNDTLVEFANGWALLLEEKLPPVIHVIHLPTDKDVLRVSSLGIYSKLWQVPQEVKEKIETGFTPVSIHDWIFELFSRENSKIPSEKEISKNSEVHATQKTLPSSDRSGVLRRAHKNLKQNLVAAQSNLERARETLKTEATLMTLHSHRDQVKKDQKSFFLELETGHFSLEFGEKADFPVFIEAQFKKIKRARKSSEQLEMRLQQLQMKLLEVTRALENPEYSSSSVTEILSTGQGKRSIASANVNANVQSAKSIAGGLEPVQSLATLYILPEGAEIMVGKNALASDRLIKQATGDTLWFHTTEGKGAHVLLRFKRKQASKEYQNEAIRCAQILAVHHSDWQKTYNAEIYSGLRANLKKPRGAAPGLWIAQSCKRIFVRYGEEELKTVLRFRS